MSPAQSSVGVPPTSVDSTRYTVETLGQLEPGLSREWLLTNGAGAFSSGTAVGCNTRRYHGLLCAVTLPPVGRFMTLSRVGEIVTLDDKPERNHELSVNQFGSNFHPRGERYLRSFELTHTARWTYVVEGATVVKELKLMRGRNVVAIRYTITAPPGRRATLRLLPFLAARDFHSLRRGSGPCFNVAQTARQQINVRDGHTAIYLRGDGSGVAFQSHGDWWFGHTYAAETERGQDDSEDLFTPGVFTVDTGPSGSATVTLWASMEPLESPTWNDEPTDTRTAWLERSAEKFAPPGEAPSHAVLRLIKSADDFLVRRRTPDGTWGWTILAGYPWFADWGRDTMISLPGLLLVPGRFDEARSVLKVFAAYVSEGMIPNRFDDYSNEPHYNTVDASLWFIHACFEYLGASGDKTFFDSVLLGACKSIVKGYKQGTRFGIKMDERDGLITQGDSHTQLTWMDAKCGETAFTPRQGKAAEINALWYHVLRLLKEDALADQVEKSFRAAFWISPFRGLADVVSMDGTKEQAIRPNQIFAVSLPNSPLTKEQRYAVVEVVRRELLTPVGLRTLAVSDPGYRAKYTGPQWLRDQAYHNGTIWPWLIGGFLEAYVSVHDHSHESVEQARRWLAPLVDQLEEACVGSINEIFEADASHRAVGAYAQAWSVAEVLRLVVLLKM